jgi:UDP-N-acetylmuramate dehydrogenase
MISLSQMPSVRGRLTENAPLAPTSWFRVGGSADILFKPADIDDLGQFLTALPDDIPVTVLGVCSNIIIRDGGIRGVVIKLGRDFTNITHDDETGIVSAGASALDINVAQYAARAGLGGLEFLSGIPGTIGGALRMNAGAYGGEVKDILIDAIFMNRNGVVETVAEADMDLSYRHNGLPSDIIFLSARFKTFPTDTDEALAKIDEIREKRRDTQPTKAQTGGSTFANPDGYKAWELIDAVGGRGLTIGGAMMSDKHCNFMLNDGTATAADLENLGDELRRRVMDKFNIDLRWENTK